MDFSKSNKNPSIIFNLPHAWRPDSFLVSVFFKCSMHPDMHYQYITVIHFDFKSHFAHSLLLHYYEAAVLKVDTSINMVRTGSKSCWWVHRFMQTVLISSWQLDVVEITQFNTHGCCVIIAALLSQWETSHLFNPVASLLFCKPLADWMR